MSGGRVAGAVLAITLGTAIAWVVYVNGGSTGHGSAAVIAIFALVLALAIERPRRQHRVWNALGAFLAGVIVVAILATPFLPEIGYRAILYLGMLLTNLPSVPRLRSWITSHPSATVGMIGAYLIVLGLVWTLRGDAGTPERRHTSAIIVTPSASIVPTASAP